MYIIVSDTCLHLRSSLRFSTVLSGTLRLLLLIVLLLLWETFIVMFDGH